MVKNSSTSFFLDGSYENDIKWSSLHPDGPQKRVSISYRVRKYFINFLKKLNETYYYTILMNRNNCYPKFFAIEEGKGYKVFYNEIYQSFKSLGFPANVLWPVAEAEKPRVLKNNYDTAKRHNTFIRRWNSNWYKSSIWTYTNKDLELLIDNEMYRIPVVNIDCDEGVLPFHSAPIF